MPIMRPTGWVIGGFFLALSTALGVARANDAERLDLVYPVEWRGAPLHEVLDQLSGEFRLPCVIDPAVSPDALNQRLRLFAAHLTGRQAWRWAARLSGLAAVERDGAVLVAPPATLPRLWRLNAAASAGSPAEQERLRTIAELRASITWIDAPLSSVARQVSNDFRLDVIFHPRILADEGLVHLEATEASLETVRTTLEEQLKAKAQIYDGALWVVPADLADELPATQPVAQRETLPAVDQPIAGVGPLDQFVVLDDTVTSWPGFSTRLSRAAGVACRVVGGAGEFGAAWQARGTVGEVLEAARLLGSLRWRLVSADQGDTAAVEIRPIRPAAP